MKKMWLLLLVVMTAFVLTACQKEYAIDGDFTAYAYGVTHGNGPELTTVTVTIENGSVAGYYIDTLQGTDVEGTFSFNDETKKELEDDYNMATEDGQLEWYEQAAALEAHWLENGVSEDEVDAEGNIDAVAGVTITVDTYYELALEALAMAKAGEFQAVAAVNGSHGPEIHTATMTVADGKFSDVVLDVRQSHGVDGTFTWKNTKIELGFDYGMATADGQLEWFEQSAEISTYVQANGWSSTSSLDDIAGVTITTDGFVSILDALFALPADDVEPAAE